MPLYSVFDPDTYNYDYFQASGPLPGQRARAHRKGLAGVQPEAVMPRLPPDAQHVGSGKEPRGIIATDHRGLAIAGLGQSQTFVQENPYISVAFALGGVLLIYKLAVLAVR